MENNSFTAGFYWRVLLFSIASLLILVCFSVGYYHPDEHFQIIEFASWKLGLNTPDKLPWEFHYQMRPSVQPALVVMVYKMFGLFGCSNPFTISLFLRLLSAALAFIAMWMIYRAYTRKFREGWMERWFLLLSFLLWFSLYNGVRFSSENWSGSLFIIGYAYLFLRKAPLRTVDFLVTGILLGLSFIFRFQAGLLIAGFLGWIFFMKNPTFPGKIPHWKSAAWIVLGIGISTGAGILIDRWFYGNWNLTLWNYFQQNLLEDKISGFGIEPWWFYFWDVFIRALPPFSFVYIASFLLVFWFLRKDPLTWTILPFLLFHFFIGHKETRFFYPLMGFVPVIIMKATELVKEKWVPSLLTNKWTLAFAKGFWTVNLLFIGVVFFIPADSMVNMYQRIYEKCPESTLLYYTSDNPYYRAKEVSFYKRQNLQTRKYVEGELPDSSSSRKVVAVRSKDPEMALFKGHTVLYCSYPDWVRMFNVNGWMDRTQIWYVYEISK